MTVQREVPDEDIRRQTSIGNILRRAGVTNVQQIRDMLKTTRWSVFAETYFITPPDLEGVRKPSKDDKLVLDIWQRKVLDKVQDMWYNRGKPSIKQYLLVVAPRGYGKSIIMAVLNAILIIIGINTTAIFAPSETQSETIIAKTKYFIANSLFQKRVLPRGQTAPGMQKIYTGSLSIGMKNGAFSVGNSNNEKTIRGGHFSAVLIDEYARMSNHTVKAGIFPMVNRSNGPVIAITTPFGRFGPAWEAYENKKGVWDVVTVDPFEARHMTPEIMKEKIKLFGGDIDLARQELMAEFISDEQAVFKDAWYENLYKEDYKNFHPYSREYDYYMSLDIGWDSNRSVMTIGHWEKNEWGDEYIKVDVIKSWEGPDPQDLQNQIIRYCIGYQIRLIVPDGQSVGVETLQRLKKRLKEEKLSTIIYTSDTGKKKLGFITTGGSGKHSKTNLVSEGTERMSRHELRLPSHTSTDGEESYELEKEMHAFAYEATIQGASVRFGRAITQEPDDRVLAMLYLIFAFTVRRPRRDGVAASSSERDYPGQRIRFRSHLDVEGGGAAAYDLRRGHRHVKRNQNKRNFGKY